MKFQDYNQKPNEQGYIRTPHVDILVCDDARPCIMCGEPTEFVDVFSEGRFCSDECMDEFYRRLVENEEARAAEDV